MSIPKPSHFVRPHHSLALMVPPLTLPRVAWVIGTDMTYIY